MKKPNEYPVEDLLTNESFLNFYFKKKMDDQLDWEDWADESPANAARAAEATRLLDRLSLKWGAGQIREHWAEVQAQISAEQTPIFRLKTQIGWGKWAAIAASFLVAAAVGFGIWQSSRADEMLALTNDHHDRLMIFKLPDGSKLQVKPHSKVLISHDFGQKTRDLHLTGEAIFEVAKDPARPFRVYADALTVTALGTTFGIRANEGEAELKVVLTEGKIRVENKSESAPQADELIAGY